MAEENVPAPTRTDDQLVPVMARLPIGKSNILMDFQKKLCEQSGLPRRTSIHLEDVQYYKKYLKIAACNPRQPMTVIDEEGGKKKKALPAEADSSNSGCIYWTLCTQPQDDTSANVVYDTPFLADAETGADSEKSKSETDTKILNVAEEQGEDVSNMVALEERTIELDEGQAGSEPGKTPESRPPPEREHMEEDQTGSDPGQSHVAQAGPNPEPMQEDFTATVYPK
ncbi:hypothetical protein Tco_0164392, partial [Tanacetum coccineum]